MKSRYEALSRSVSCRVIAFLLCLGAAAPASAGTLSISLGNTATGMVPGTIVDISEVLAAQSGQPAPFGQGYGSDSSENFTASWTFNFAPIADPIVAASMQIGIYDSDAGSPGIQVYLFDVAGNDLTQVADAAFELAGGASFAYDVYTLNLGSVLASLASGSVVASLSLKGPVQGPSSPASSDWLIQDFNGANLIYSTLSITTESVNVPEPGTLALLGIGLTCLGLSRRRKAN